MTVRMEERPFHIRSLDDAAGVWSTSARTAVGPRPATLRSDARWPPVASPASQAEQRLRVIALQALTTRWPEAWRDALDPATLPEAWAGAWCVQGTAKPFLWWSVAAVVLVRVAMQEQRMSPNAVWWEDCLPSGGALPGDDPPHPPNPELAYTIGKRAYSDLKRRHGRDETEWLASNHAPSHLVSKLGDPILQSDIGHWLDAIDDARRRQTGQRTLNPGEPTEPPGVRRQNTAKRRSRVRKLAAILGLQAPPPRYEAPIGRPRKA